MLLFVADNNVVIEARSLAEAEKAAKKYLGMHVPVREAIPVRAIKGHVYLRTATDQGAFGWAEYAAG